MGLNPSTSYSISITSLLRNGSFVHLCPNSVCASIATTGELQSNILKWFLLLFIFKVHLGYGLKIIWVNVHWPGCMAWLRLRARTKKLGEAASNRLMETDLLSRMCSGLLYIADIFDIMSNW